jgi:cytochrome c553
MKTRGRQLFTPVLCLLAVGMAVSGCLVQTDNSVNGDAATFAPLPPGVSKDFAQASVIFKKNCAQCHSDDWAGLSEQQLIQQNYIVPGNPDASELYGRLKGANAKGGFTGDMPQSLPPLSRQDIRTIRNWIEKASTSTPVPSPSFSDTPFGFAQAIIVENCATCHHHQSWKQFGEADFIAKQLVVPGKADSSVLYQNLSGANVPGVDPGEMPLGAAPLAADDLQTIAAWINQISPTAEPSATPSPSPSPSSDPSSGPSSSPSVSPSPVATSTPSPMPSPTVAVLNAAQRTAAALAVVSESCSDCHGGVKTATSTAFQGQTVAAFANFTTDSDFVTAGLIISGNPASSWLIRSLKTYGDIATMPQADNPLSSADEAVLSAWISGIGQP